MKKRFRNRVFNLFWGCFSLLLGLMAMSLAAETFIVKDGKANAEIVVSKDERRPRMAALAALELQYYLQKMSGARLPIVTELDGAFPVKIYVGRSAATDKLGVKPDGLKAGAFRMVSGNDWLVLLGEDHDFSPPKPCPRSHNDLKRARKAWDEKVGDRTDAAWGYPYGGMHKRWWNPRDYEKRMTERYGADNKHVWNPRSVERTSDYPGPGMATGFWLSDWGGTFNAVCEFLRTLGVRWYMPGELGEVVPKRTTIPLPKLDETVRPDFPTRRWQVTRIKDWDGIIWQWRIGINSDFETLGHGGTHGMGDVLVRKEMKEKHPECYALIRGKRVTGEKRGGIGEPCFSSERLVDESVAYLRFRFDEFGERMVQFSPPDGLRKCQCEKCAKVPTSDLVHGFLDKVARKLYKTNPDNVVLGAAYGSYQDCPESIERFSPNYAVTLNNFGRPTFDDPEKWKAYWDEVEKWRGKVAPGHLMRVENNRFEVAGPPTFPVFHPHTMAKDLRALKGVSLGDRNEISIGRKTVLGAPALSHLTLYVNARFLWDADQDVDALLDDYFEKFYGPASGAMKDAITYAEDNNNRSEGRRAGMDYTAAAEFVDRLLKARAAAGGGVHQRRVEAMLEEVVPKNIAGAPEDLGERAKAYAAHLRQREASLKQRESAPVFKYWNLGNSKWNEAREKGALDGVLDEAYWKHGKTFLDDRKKKMFFAILHEGRALHVGIRCERDPGRELNVATDKDDDPAIFDGDHVEFLLETDAHSFYQIAVNPAGAVFCRDMSEGGRSAGDAWTAQAEVAVNVAKDCWNVEMVLPFDKSGADPIHKVACRKPPTKTFPWFFNVVNVRVDDDGVKTAAFVNPKGGNVRDPSSFAKLAR